MFTKDTISLVKRAWHEETDRTQKKRHLFLLDFLVHGFISNRLSTLDDEMQTYESAAKVRIDGKEEPFRKIPVLLVNEPSQERRRRIYESGDKIRAKLHAYHQQIFTACESIAHELCFHSYLDMNQTLKGTDYTHLSHEMKRILATTHTTFIHQFNEFIPRAGIDTDSVFSFDMGRLLRGPDCDAYFPKEQAIPTLRRTLAGLGIDLDSQKNIHVDFELRDNKVNRAVCFGIDTPRDVRILVNPAGGRDDYSSLFHEMGHAQHFGHTRADIPFEFRQLGVHSTSETFSFHFQYLFMNKTFLQQYIRIPEGELLAILRFERFDKLIMLRRYCAKLLYELKYWKNDLRKLNQSFEPTEGAYADFGECYSDLLYKAIHVRYFPILHLVDFDQGFYSAEYLKAWMFEAQLRAHLRACFGDDWFVHRGAGDTLKELFSTGSMLLVDEMAHKIGDSHVDSTALIRDFEER